VVLQTGLFSKEENAQEQADRLKVAGFEGIIKERDVKGTTYWAVNVVPGSDINRTILQLHEKGFDSFPVF
jgi:cell division septation protein DedD